MRDSQRWNEKPQLTSMCFGNCSKLPDFSRTIRVPIQISISEVMGRTPSCSSSEYALATVL